MAEISEYLQNILDARYGEDVRESIYNAIKQTYDDAATSGNANMEVASARGTFNTLNDRLDNSDNTMAAMKVEILETVFPIGSTYITQEEINPYNILGFGTWERLKGKVCLGLDEDDEDFSTIGNTGGEKEHKLTVNEMPNHRHEQQSYTFVGGGNQIASGTGQYFSQDTSYTLHAGGDQPHNNMQPYEIVGYMWIRRA